MSRKKKIDKVSHEDIDYASDIKSAILLEKLPFAHIAVYILVAFIVAAGVWAYYAKLDEVTVVEGVVIPSSPVQTAQSLEGGIVKNIFVREGDFVKKGQKLAVLDDTLFKASYKESLSKYVTLQAANVRLLAQAHEKKQLVFSKKFNKEYPALVKREKRLFKANMFALHKSLKALYDQYTLANKELAIKKPMAEKKLLSKIELYRAERTVQAITSKIQNEKAVFYKQ